jgi:3-oxoacyl-[acyl-carrier-protein] synthase-1
VRAGVTALGEHPFLIDQAGRPMPGAVDAALDPHEGGPGRLVALAESALREACAPLTGAGTPRPRLPVFLGLPEVRPGFTDREAEAVRSGLARLGGLPVEIAEVRAFAHGHAAGWSALAEAAERMESGSCDACLVGGVDSYFDPETMEWLDANRQLVGTVARSGFVPGEGAGFCLLMTESCRDRLGLPPLAHVRAVALGQEAKLIKSTDVCIGEGLTAAVRNAVAGLRSPADRISEVLCDINGERYRADEWAFVSLRLSGYFDDPTAYLSPAECWGDVGAATGPLLVMLACQAAVRGYARGPRTMIWASSEGGRRGAAVLEAATPA